ncbi:MAG: putative porin precursor transrane protein, partial [Ramlibacter sp.]|nr:putative porin precursor transrane protein [Ramlibacter sp.]
GIWNVVGPHNFKFAVSKYGQNVGAQPSATKLSLGWEQMLSKRTMLYAHYGRVKNSGGATFALGGATTAANTPASGFDMGIGHTF